MKDLVLNLLIQAKDTASGVIVGVRNKFAELGGATEQYRTALDSALQNPVGAATLISYVVRAKAEFSALASSGVGALNAIGQSTIGAARNIAQMRSDIDGLRSGFIRFGASVAASGAQAAQGIGFEKAFSDVRKVVSGTEEELAGLESQLKQIAQGVSVPLEGLTQIAAFGGQLGLPTKDLGEFTRLVSEMSTAFGILPAEAGEAIGQLKNIFGLTLPELRTFGDVINTVADNANTSERAILDVLTRAGGTAERFGLLKNETTALAAAMLSLGKPPEIAATAMRNLLGSLQNADKQTQEFTDGLKSIGIDAKQLADDIEKNPKAALDSFLATLATLDNRSRGNVLDSLLGKGEDAAVLGDLVRSLGEYQRLAALASQQEIFTGSMARTFQERERTVSAALGRLKNNLAVFSIESTALFLPAIRAAADGLGSLLANLAKFAEQYPNLSAFARIAVVFSTLAGAFRLLGAAFNSLLPAVGPAIGGLKSLVQAAASLGIVNAVKTALTGLSGVITAVFGNTVGKAVIGIGLLTGGFHALTAAISGVGGVLVSVLSNPLVLLLGGLAALALRVSAAGSVLGGLGVAIASTGRLLLQLAGGWIGVAVTGLTFLAVKFLEVKDKAIEFAGTQTTLAEVIGATWRVITGYIGESITQMIGWLSELTGVNAKIWDEIKLAAGDVMDEWRIDIGSAVNALISVFAGFGAAAGIAISRTIERVELKFDNLVALAKAAGKDIQAALTGDFSGSNFTAQLEKNRAENKQAYDNMIADMKSAYADASLVDYLGDDRQSVGKFVTAVKKGAGDAIAYELYAGRQREQIEKATQAAKQKSLDETQKDHKKTIDAQIAEEKRLADAAKKYRDLINTNEKQRRAELQAIDAAGQSESPLGIDDAYLQRQQQLLEAEKAARQGNIDAAIEQYRSVAEAATQAAAQEQEAIRTGAGTYVDKLGYMAQEKKARDAITALLRQQETAETESAKKVRAASQQAQKDLDHLDGTLKSIQNEAKNGINIQVKTNAAQVTKELDNLAQKSGGTPATPGTPATQAPPPTDANAQQAVGDPQQPAPNAALEQSQARTQQYNQEKQAIAGLLDGQQQWGKDASIDQIMQRLGDYQQTINAAKAKVDALSQAEESGSQTAQSGTQTEIQSQQQLINLLQTQIATLEQLKAAKTASQQAGEPQQPSTNQAVMTQRDENGKIIGYTDNAPTPNPNVPGMITQYDENGQTTGYTDQGTQDFLAKNSLRNTQTDSNGLQQQQAALSAIKTELDSMPPLDIETEQANNDIQQVQTDLDGLTPPDVTVNADASAVDDAIAKIDSIPTEKTVTIRTVYADGANAGAAAPSAAAPAAPGYSDGITLPGFGGGDIIPAMLEPGEAVSNKDLVREVQQKTGIKDYQLAVRYLIEPGRYAFGGMAGTPDQSFRSAPPEFDRTVPPASPANLTPIILEFPGFGSVGPVMAAPDVMAQLTQMLNLAILQRGRRRKG